MTIADDIFALVQRKGRRHRNCLTEEDIEFLYGQGEGNQQRVNRACRQLVREKRLIRNGKGGQDDPYTYSLPPTKIKRRFGGTGPEERTT